MDELEQRFSKAGKVIFSKTLCIFTSSNTAYNSLVWKQHLGNCLHSATPVKNALNYRGGEENPPKTQSSYQLHSNLSSAFNDYISPCTMFPSVNLNDPGPLIPEPLCRTLQASALQDLPTRNTRTPFSYLTRPSWKQGDKQKGTTDFQSRTKQKGGLYSPRYCDSKEVWDFLRLKHPCLLKDYVVLYKSVPCK